MRIVTDSKGVEEAKDPDTDHVFQILRHFATAGERAHWAKRYREGNMGYGEAKQAAFEAINREIGPFRDRYFAIRKDTAALDQILRQGAEKAHAVASGVMDRVRKKVGLR
jgi:tryptophanyl-tRNA synthetase